MNNLLLEPKAQRWRAVAELSDGSIGLIYLGMSVTQIRENYKEAFEDVLAGEVKKATRKIRLEQYEGLPDRGKWNQKGTLAIPQPQP